MSLPGVRFGMQLGAGFSDKAKKSLSALVSTNVVLRIACNISSVLFDPTSDLVDLLKPTEGDLDDYGYSAEDLIIQCSFDKEACTTE